MGACLNAAVPCMDRRLEFQMRHADQPGCVIAIANGHKAILEAQLANLLGQAGIASAKDRAREIWLLCDGAMVLVMIHEDRSG